MKRVNLRLDIASGQALPREELFRIVLADDGPKLDAGFRLPGRGAYLKKDRPSVLLAQKSHALSRALKAKVSDAFYEGLLKTL